MSWSCLSHVKTGINDGEKPLYKRLEHRVYSTHTLKSMSVCTHTHAYTHTGYQILITGAYSSL